MFRDDNIFTIGVRVDKDIWDYLHKYKPRAKMSDIIRDMIYQRMEEEDPLKLLDDMVDRLERGEYDPKQFIQRFDGMKHRYRKNEVMYSLANEKINELENRGVLHQAFGRLRMQEDMNKFI